MVLGQNASAERILWSLLDHDHDDHVVDLQPGAGKTPCGLVKPELHLPSGTIVRSTNAILRYLAQWRDSGPPLSMILHDCGIPGALVGTMKHDNACMVACKSCPHAGSSRTRTCVRQAALASVDICGRVSSKFAEKRTRSVHATG
eukprot:s2907_g3.t2